MTSTGPSTGYEANICAKESDKGMGLIEGPTGARTGLKYRVPGANDLSVQSTYLKHVDSLMPHDEALTGHRRGGRRLESTYGSPV